MKQQLRMVGIGEVLKAIKRAGLTDKEMTLIERCLHRSFRRLCGVRRRRPAKGSMYRTPDGCFYYDEARLSDGQMIMLNESVWMDYIRATLAVPRDGYWYKLLDSEGLTMRLRARVQRHIETWFKADPTAGARPSVRVNGWGVYVKRMPKDSTFPDAPSDAVPAAGSGFPGDGDTEHP